jgi:hypothetical protein
MRQRIFFGVRHIRLWTIVPWIDTTDFGWGFTWLCFIVAKYTIIEVDEGE